MQLLINLKGIILKVYICPFVSIFFCTFVSCNKVTCRCGALFCYVCGKSITGYEHFSSTNSRCNLWNNMVGPEGVLNRVPERELHQVIYL